MLMIFGPSRTMNGTRYRVIITSTCSAPVVSDDVTLTVNTAPELSDHPDEFKGCPGGTATFSVVAAGTDLKYQWQVNSGTGFADVSNTGTYSGTTTDILTISNLALAMNGHLVQGYGVRYLSASGNINLCASEGLYGTFHNQGA